MRAELPVLVVTGPPGVGKTSVAEEMYDHLAAYDLPHAVIDLDALCLSYPFAPGDEFNNRMALANLRDVWRNYAAAGAERLILVRVVESRDYLDELAGVLPGAAFTVCRLTASTGTLRDRLAQRERGSAFDKLFRRAEYLAAYLAEHDVADLTVATDGATVPDLARTILTRTGWLPEAALNS